MLKLRTDLVGKPVRGVRVSRPHGLGQPLGLEQPHSRPRRSRDRDGIAQDRPRGAALRDRVIETGLIRLGRIGQDPRVAPMFIPGLDLARLFYTEAVRPLLDQECPGLAHSAALIGSGSEVLGFDSLRSTDHNWGPRLQIFLPDDLLDQAEGCLPADDGKRLPGR